MVKIKSVSTGIHSSQNRSEDIYEFVRPSGFILDIGCGNGDKIDYIKELEATKLIIGIDIAKNILRYKDNRICADAQYLPFKSNIFDSIICSEILEHLHCPEICIKEIKRTLKKDGMVFFSTPVLNIDISLLVPLFRKIAGIKLEKGEHLHVFSTKRLYDMISQDLCIIEMRHLGYTTILKRLKNPRLKKFRHNIDIKLSNLSKKFVIIRYFASQIWIKCKYEDTSSYTEI